MIKKITIGAIAPLIILLNGCGKIEVASVTGEQLGYAKGILVGQGFEVKTVEKEMSDVPEGQVISQTPPPESSIKKGEVITLTIAKSPVYNISGTFTLYDSDLGSNGNNCYGTGGYSDIRSSMPVTVKDGKGAIIATGYTSSGTYPQDSSYYRVTCVFNFNITQIPKRNFYSIEVGRRGNISYSFEEMKNQNWEVGFSLS